MKTNILKKRLVVLLFLEVQDKRVNIVVQPTTSKSRDGSGVKLSPWYHINIFVHLLHRFI